MSLYIFDISNVLPKFLKILGTRTFSPGIKKYSSHIQLIFLQHTYKNPITTIHLFLHITTSQFLGFANILIITNKI